MTTTIQARVCAALVTAGYTKEKELRGGCLVYHKSGVSDKYYVGSRGSVRLGTTRDTSISLSAKTVDLLLRAPLTTVTSLEQEAARGNKK